MLTRNGFWGGVWKANKRLQNHHLTFVTISITCFSSIFETSKSTFKSLFCKLTLEWSSDFVFWIFELVVFIVATEKAVYLMKSIVKKFFIGMFWFKLESSEKSSKLFLFVKDKKDEVVLPFLEKTSKVLTQFSYALETLTFLLKKWNFSIL